jgi:Kef-type K+ transport system membrane component KefB
VVQIITGILLGPGVLGRVFPDYYSFVFNPAVVQSLNGIAWWAVMLFVCIAGIELDLKKAWAHRRESTHHRRAGARHAAAVRLPRGAGHAWVRRLDGAEKR